MSKHLITHKLKLERGRTMEIIKFIVSELTS